MTKIFQPYKSVCAISQNWLPSDWVEQIHSIIKIFQVRTILTGESTLSREVNTSHVSIVSVVFGEECASQLPWLDSLYRNEFIDFIKKSMNRIVYPAIHRNSAININCLNEVSSDYEKHIDTNSVTGLLFVCDANEQTGGQLIFEDSDGTICRVDPQLGKFIAFDAREMHHFVSPLRKKFERISIPMNYYDDPINQFRPDGLDERLMKQA